MSEIGGVTANYRETPGGKFEPVPCGEVSCLTAFRFSEQRGIVTGLTRALKMSKSVKNNSKGMAALQAYLASQIKITKEVPF